MNRKITDVIEANNFSQIISSVDELKSISAECKNIILMNDLQQIEDMIHPTSFKIAVVGEFSRGKSTLINKLLDLDLLPSGDLPTTALITKINYGQDKSISWHKQNGEKVQLELIPNVLNNLSMKNNCGDLEGILEIQLPDQWLFRNNIQLIDTPGFDKISQKKEIEVNRLISECDAVLLLIDGPSPMNLKEREILEDHILSKKVPHIAIVITKLDLIEEIEREDIVFHVKNSIRGIFGELPIAVTTEDVSMIDERVLSARGIEDIKRLISCWVESEESPVRRKEQIKFQLTGICEMLNDSLYESRKIMELSDEQKKIELRKIEREINHNALYWQKIKTDVNRREQECFDLVEDTLLTQKLPAIQRIVQDIDNQKNVNQLQKWVDSDLQYTLRRFIKHEIIPKAERAIIEKIEKDQTEINEQLDHYFNHQINIESQVNTGIYEDAINVKQVNMGDSPDFTGYWVNSLTKYIKLDNPQKIKSFKIPKKISAKYIKTSLTQLKTAAPQILLQATIDLGIKAIQKHLEFTNLKNHIKNQMDSTIDNTLYQLHDSLKKNIHEIYDSYIQTIKSSQEAWIDACKEELTIQGAESYKRVQRYEELLDRVERIKTDIVR